jgi:hypothetical protein
MIGVYINCICLIISIMATGYVRTKQHKHLWEGYAAIAINIFCILVNTWGWK